MMIGDYIFIQSTLMIILMATVLSGIIWVTFNAVDDIRYYVKAKKVEKENRINSKIDENEYR